MVKQKSIPNIFLIFSLLALICTNTMTYIMLSGDLPFNGSTSDEIFNDYDKM